MVQIPKSISPISANCFLIWKVLPDKINSLFYMLSKKQRSAL